MPTPREAILQTLFATLQSVPAATVLVWRNPALADTTGRSADPAGRDCASLGMVSEYHQGLITFTTAPASGVAITAGFQFDVPVCFDTDMLDVTHDLERLGSITSIPLIEVRR